MNEELVVVGQQGSRLLGLHGKGLAQSVQDKLQRRLRLLEELLGVHGQDVDAIGDAACVGLVDLDMDGRSQKLTLVLS